jgi:hypothetical protein
MCARQNKGLSSRYAGIWIGLVLLGVEDLEDKPVTATKLEVANGEVASNCKLRACPHTMRCEYRLVGCPTLGKGLWKT